MTNAMQTHAGKLLLTKALKQRTMWFFALLLLFLSGEVSATTTTATQARSESCPQAKCFIDLINVPGRQNANVFSLKCGGCRRVLTWQVTDWLAAKLQDGVLEGVQIVKPTSATRGRLPLMAFDGALNNVQHLVLTANVKGLEPLLPPLIGDWGYKVQKQMFQIYGLVNLTLANSVIQGLAPLVAEFPPGNQDETTMNSAVPRPKSQTPEDRAALEGKWASYVRIQNCTLSNTDLALRGKSLGGVDFTTPVVEATGRACLLELGNMYTVFWPGHVEILNTTFDNITTSAPPGSGLRSHMLCLATGSKKDTVTVRASTFSNIHDALGHSLDLIHTSMVYTGRMSTKNLTMQRCRFINIKAGMLAALEVEEVTVDNCEVNGARLMYGGFVVMSKFIQQAKFVNSKFSHIQLGAASDAIPLNQEFYTTSVGLVKTGSMATAHVHGCLFRNVSLLPSARQHAPLTNKSQQTEGSIAFVRTAVIAAGASARVLQSTFVDCFTPAVVYAFPGEMETLGLVYSAGSANRGARDAAVSLVLHESAFVRNVYGVYADGFQVIVSNCSFTASSVSGVRISRVPCLVMNGTTLHDAAVSVQHASNPGGTNFAFCRMGWFPLWLNDQVQAAADVPGTARVAAARHNIPGRLTDTFDSPVSVYMESVSISGVQGQPALSLRDIRKASLQRVSIFGSVGGGALQASDVAGLLLLQCRVVNNSAEVTADALNVAGGGTFTAVHNLYLLETVFAGNVGPEAGAMLLQSCRPVVINSCTYHDNTASQSGGAVRAIASDSIVVDTSTLQQPGNISCMERDALGALTSWEFVLDLSATSGWEVATLCPQALLGGKTTVFSRNRAGGSGGAVAVEGPTGRRLAAFNASRVNFLDNRANVSGGAVAVLGANRQIRWSLTNAEFLRNSASGSGGALAFTVPVQGVLCQHCHLQGNTAGLLGGALFSTAKELCVASRNQQDCIGDNVTFTSNMAVSGGATAYLADATAAAGGIANNSPGRAGLTGLTSKAIQHGRLQCSRQDLNKAGSSLRVLGPPCALVVWSPAAGTLLPYVNNGSGLPTINASVVDCWCSTVYQIPGPTTSASLIPLTARLVFNNTVLLEKAVGPDGHVVFDKVDFNQPPQQYNLTLQLSPTTESALAANVPKPLPINLTVQARPCTTGEELGIDGRCRTCSVNTYGRNGQCLKCEKGARCPGGALLLPEDGWWHSSPTSDVFIPCLQPEACRGSREQLQDYQQQHYDDLERAMHRALLAGVDPDYQSAVCSNGYEGHLCASCGPNKSRTRTYRCGTCSSGSSVILIAILGTALVVAYVWFVSASTIKDTQQPWGTLKVSDATYCLTWFLQLLFVLAAVPIPWPPAIAWLPKTAETMLSSFSSSTASLACLLKPSRSMPSVAGQMMIFQMCLMLVLPAMVVLLELFVAACKPVVSKFRAFLSTRRGRQAAMAPCRGASGNAPNLKQRVIISVLSSLLFFYPTILQSTMSLFVCKTLDPADGSVSVYQAQSKHGWWMSDLDIKCYGGWHTRFALAFGLPCLLFFCLGIPLVAAALPIWAWKGKQLQEDHYRETYAFLHWRYRDTRWYYSIVQRTWLLVLVVGVVFTSGDTMLQLFVYEAVLMASLICLIVFKPAGSQVAGRLDICVNLAALLNGFAAVFCVASAMDTGAITGSSFGMRASGSVGLGVVVVVTNGLLLLSILVFILKVHASTSPRAGQVVDKMRTWGASIGLAFRMAS